VVVFSILLSHGHSRVCRAFLIEFNSVKQSSLSCFVVIIKRFAVHVCLPRFICEVTDVAHVDSNCGFGQYVGLRNVLLTYLLTYYEVF